MTVAKILAVATGLLVSWLISHTKSKQGRLRPWYLIFGFCSVAIAATIFLFSGNTLGDNYWYYFFTLLICYHTIGTSYFYLFRDNIVSLSTHNAKEKAQLTFIRKCRGLSFPAYSSEGLSLRSLSRYGSSMISKDMLYL